jgi:outer membrane protein OmpA-like peptidoglycan-associated protein
MMRSHLYSVALAGMVLVVSSADATTLNPVRARLSDQAVRRDHKALDDVSMRLAVFDTVSAPERLYARAQAQAWLQLARDQYALNDESGLDKAAFDAAGALATALENRSSTLQAPADSIPGSWRVRKDLWQLADSLKRTEALRCVAADLGQLEVQLVRAGHEALRCHAWEPHPIVAAAEGHARLIRQRAAECIIPVAVQPAPVVIALPEPEAPAAPPPALITALRRLGAFNNIHFDLNADTISVASVGVLDSVIGVMRAVPEIRATLIGHTDPRGSAAYNMALGRRRARAVYSYLVDAGVDSSRLSFGSQGMAAPLALGTGLRELALNRRVEIQYAGPGGITLDVRRQERDVQIERVRAKVSARTSKPPVARKPATADKPAPTPPVATGP